MRGRELIATDKPAVVPKPVLDPIMVEDGQSNRRLPDPPWADECNRSEVLCETNDLLD